MHDFAAVALPRRLFTPAVIKVVRGLASQGKNGFRNRRHNRFDARERAHQVLPPQDSVVATRAP
jgi:hypothetical protein